MDRKLVIITSIIFCFVIYVAQAFPSPPAEFYGYVVIDSKFAEKGTLIEIFDTKGNLCGSTIMKENKRYGYLSCYDDDSLTIKDQGPIFSENVYFNVNGKLAVAFGNTTWSPGKPYRVDLVVGNLKRSLPILEEPKPLIPVNKFKLSFLLLFLLSPIYFIIIKKIQNELQ